MSKCLVKGCKEDFYGKGYCRIHYDRQRRGTDLNKPISQRKCKPKKLCIIDDCEEFSRTRGLCNVHYHRLRRKGHAGEEKKGPINKAGYLGKVNTIQDIPLHMLDRYTERFGE